MVRERETYVRSGPSIVFVRLLLPAGEAVSAPPLSATLGQVQINSSDFCKQFNAASEELYETGTLVNVHLFRNSDNSFYFRFRGVFSPYFFFQAALRRKKIPLEMLYDIFLFFNPTSPNFFKAKEFFGSLRSMRFRILF